MHGSLTLDLAHAFSSLFHPIIADRLYSAVCLQGQPDRLLACMWSMLDHVRIY